MLCCLSIPAACPAANGFLQVNYLGHWLLTHQLLTGQSQLHSRSKKHLSTADQHQEQQGVPEVGRDRHGTRIVMLSSMTHNAGRIKFDDLQGTKSYSGFHRYADSKLAQLLAVRSFAGRMTRCPT